jgi:Zn-dependent protease with chaperone function
MDFFQAQQQSNRLSVWLIFLFVLTLLLFIVFLSFVVYLLLNISSLELSLNSYSLWQNSEQGHISIACIALLMLSVFTYSAWQLRHDGADIAHWLGAIPLNLQHKSEQELIAVVEEMSIASGHQVPLVFVLQGEQGINAFVLGNHREDTVLVVTYGLVKHLNREEKQGVVAHEFAHIVSGDTRLNMHLMSAFSSLLFLRTFAIYVMRFGTSKSSLHTASNGLFVLSGVMLLVVGSVGSVLAELLKAGISRQRETHADAKAIQFTRFPEGLASALYKIKTLRLSGREGGALKMAKAQWLSHLCFVPSYSGLIKVSAFTNWFDTHPPLAERIKRIAPAFSIKKKYQRRENKITSDIKGSAYFQPNCMIMIMQMGIGESGISSLIGHAQTQHLHLARLLQQKIPSGIQQRMRESNSAMNIIEALFIRLNKGDEQALYAWLANNKKLDTSHVKELKNIANTLPSNLWLVVMELAVPALNRLSLLQKAQWLTSLSWIIEWDDQWHLREVLLYSFLHARLKLVPKVHIQKYSKERVFHVLFSLIINESKSRSNALLTYQRIYKTYGFSQATQLLPGEIEMSEVMMKLSWLIHLTWIEKKQLIDDCFDLMKADQQMSLKEYETIRVLTELLGCPMPPLLEVNT